MSVRDAVLRGAAIKEARKDWGWKHKVTLDEMTQLMIENLKNTYS